MAVQVQENQSVKHDGVIYHAGDIVHGLEQHIIEDLERLGVIKNLEAPATPAAPVQPQTALAPDPEDLERGNSSEQLVNNANRDVQDAIDTLNAPGEPVNPTAAEQAALQQPAAPATPAAPVQPAPLPEPSAPQAPVQPQAPQA